MKKTLSLVLVLLLVFPAAFAENTVHRVFHAKSQSKAPFTEAPTLESSPFGEGEDLLRVDFINIKIGDAILLRCGGESMLIDGGNGDKLPWLELFFGSQGINGFTYYMNTHSDDDHLNGAVRLVTHGYTAKEFLTKYSRDARVDTLTKLFNALDRKGIPHRQIFPGDTMMLGGAELTFIQNTRKGVTGVNPRSMMVYIRYKDATMLLPADVTGKSLSQVVEDYPQFMDVDLLKSPHHGYNRIAPEIFQAISPEAVIITSNMDHGKNLGEQVQRMKMPHYYISMGTVSALTDGESWYVYQTPVE